MIAAYPVVIRLPMNADQRWKNDFRNLADRRPIRRAKIISRRLKPIAKGFVSGLLPQRTIEVAGSGRALSGDAVAIDAGSAFQPDAALIAAYAHYDECDSANIVRTHAGSVLYKDIPYSLYQGNWHFHPNRIGGYLVTARPLAKAVRTASRLRQLLSKLPNGGLALYYPRTIPTTRFQTPELLYSGISQGQLLAGYTRLIAQDKGENQREWRNIAAKIALSLQFPVEQGGVSADGNTILEAPNFRSCPEIVLNGWLDALIHLHDYLQFIPDRALGDFYHRNIQTLVRLLPYFDCGPERLSRYSNLCPYVFRVHLARRSPLSPAVRIGYLSRESGFCDRSIEDIRQLGCPRIIYDNGIHKRGVGYIDLFLSVAGHYDIRIEVAADCRKVSFDPGAVDESSTTPHPIYGRQSIAPIAPYDGHLTSFFVQPQELCLFTGCPTNFMKHGKKNHYHSYHVAALYDLALTIENGNERRAITECAERWLSYIAEPRKRGRGFIFEDPARFVKKIAHFRANGAVRSLEELRALAAGGITHRTLNE